MDTISRITQLAKEQKRSMAYLCEQMGVARVYFNDLKKNNREIPMDKLQIIAGALNTTTDYLLGNETQAEANSPTEPKLSEGEKLWLQLYNSVSEDTRNILIGMMIAIDKLPTEEKEEALSRVRDDLKSLE